MATVTTERVKVRSALLSVHQLRHALEKSPFAVAAFDIDGVIQALRYALVGNADSVRQRGTAAGKAQRRRLIDGKGERALSVRCERQIEGHHGRATACWFGAGYETACDTCAKKLPLWVTSTEDRPTRRKRHSPAPSHSRRPCSNTASALSIWAASISAAVSRGL